MIKITPAEHLREECLNCRQRYKVCTITIGAKHMRSFRLCGICRRELRHELATVDETDRDKLIACEVITELRRAMQKFSKPFNSAHEGYAVLLEEVDEAWAEIKKNDYARAREEMVQVAAMAIRWLHDIGSAHAEPGAGP